MLSHVVNDNGNMKTITESKEKVLYHCLLLTSLDTLGTLLYLGRC